MAAQQPAGATQTPTAAVPQLTLAQVLRRAEQYSPQFQQAVTAAGVAGEARLESRDALLPSVNFNSQYLYTQGNYTPTGRFIANNAVHEYLAQGDIHADLYSPTLLGRYHLAQTSQLLAAAQMRIAGRGLRLTVVEGYYGLLAAHHNMMTALRSLQEARSFLRITRDLEKGGEVAHSDVLKAELQVTQRQTAAADATLAEEQARLALAVLLFPNPEQPFHLRDNLASVRHLPTVAQVNAMAGQHNPILEVAQASLQQAKDNVGIAKAGYLPTLSLDYWYGIDAPNFALKWEGHPNLGYAAAATLSIPLWNWGATHSRVVQARLQQHQAQVQLSYTQRQMIASLDSYYESVQVAQKELALLRHSLDLAQEGLRLSVLRYRHGETTVLEVVTAEDALTQARYAWTQGEVRYHVAVANLETLTGAF